MHCRAGRGSDDDGSQAEGEATLGTIAIRPGMKNGWLKMCPILEEPVSISTAASVG